MLQDVLSIVVLVSIGSIMVVAWRLARGVTTVRANAQLTWTLAGAGAVIAAAGSAVALGSGAALSSAIGLLEIGLTPNVIEHERRLRIAIVALAAGGGLLLLLALRLRTRSGWLSGIAADLHALGKQLRADVVRCHSDETGRSLLTTVAVLTVCGAIARALLVTYPIGADESTTVVWFASRSPLDILTDYGIPNNHVLHTLLVHWSRALFGTSELASRLPAYLSGVLLIPAAAWVGWKQFGPRVAIVLTGIVTALPPLVEYSAQARGYTLATLLITLAFLFMQYALDSPTRSAWVLYAVTAALSMFTIVTSVMGLYFIGAWLLLRPGRTVRHIVQATLWTTLAGALAAVLYLPVILHSGWRSLLSNTYVKAVAFREMPRRLLELAQVLRDCWAGALPIWLAALLVLASLVAVARRHNGGYHAAALAFGFAGMCAVVLLVNRTVPPDRSFIVILPLLAMLTAVGLEWWLSRLSRLHRFALPLVAITLSATWMVALNARTRQVIATLDPAVMAEADDYRMYCCTQGFYLDTETAAVWARGATSPRSRLLVHAWSGLGEQIRFYMLSEQLPIVRLHRFDHRAGFAQVASYDTLYVMARGARRAVAPDSQAALTLRMPIAEVQSFFVASDVAHSFRGSSLVRLVPKPGAAGFIAASGRQINTLDYPR